MSISHKNLGTKHVENLCGRFPQRLSPGQRPSSAGYSQGVVRRERATHRHLRDLSTGCADAYNYYCL
jgi:hypothetical protein